MAETKRAALPNKFKADEIYEVYVETPFTINGRFRVASGKARLKGKVAEQYRSNIRALSEND
jgi:hypothetical protein